MKSREDHGYILDFGIPDISGFLPFNERKDLKNEDAKLHVGVLLDVTVTKVSGNGRTCSVSADHATFTFSYVCLHLHRFIYHLLTSHLVVRNIFGFINSSGHACTSISHSISFYRR